MKLRLLLTKDCNRHCRGCCNKDWDLNALPVCKSYKGYSEILLTGGEPMLNPLLIRQTVADIRKQNSCPIFLYTAKSDDTNLFFDILSVVDGVTLTLHTIRDLEPFTRINDIIRFPHLNAGKSLRLNVFKNVPLKDLDLCLWKVKPNMYWVKNAPIPEDEVFMRLPTA